MSAAGGDQSLNYQSKSVMWQKMIYLVHLEYFLKKLNLQNKNQQAFFRIEISKASNRIRYRLQAILRSGCLTKPSEGNALECKIHINFSVLNRLIM